MYNPQYLNNSSNYLAPFQNRLNNYEQQAANMRPQPMSNNVVWVNGLEGARAYSLPYNAAVILLDTNDSRFYLKSTDPTGMPMIRTFKFEEVPTNPQDNNQPMQNANNGSYATKEEIQALNSKIDSLLSAQTMRIDPKNNIKSK